MIIDENKLRRQNVIVDKLIGANGNGAFEAVTGFGKTYTCLLFLKRFKDPNSKIIYVVVPSTQLKEQWEGLLINEGIFSAKVFVVNTFVTEQRRCDVLISDEGHRYSNTESLEFNKVIDCCVSPRKVFCSATFSKKHLEFLKSKGIDLVDSVPLAEALRNNWVSRFTQYNLELTFSPFEQEEYDTCTGQIKSNFPYFNGDLSLVYKLLKDKTLRTEYARDNGYDPNDLAKRATFLQRAISKRKFLCYGAASKIAIMPSLVEKLKGRAIITFSQTKKHADACHKLFPKVSKYYDSSLSPKIKTEIIRQTSLGNNKLLLTAKALNEGLDVDNLNCGIRASYVSTELDLIQSIGRVIRYIEGKNALFINFYIKDTIEKTWLKTAQKNMNNIRWITDISEIEC